MFLRLLVGAEPGAALRRVCLEIDDGSAPSVREVLAPLSMAAESATVDGRQVASDAAALEVVADGAVIIGRGQPTVNGARACRIAVVGGRDAGRVADVCATPAAVGRDPSAAIAVDDPTVSRRHLEFDLDQTGGLAVRDIGSRNGALAEREWITGPRVVTPHTLVHFGGSSLRVTSIDAATEARPEQLHNGRVALVRPPRQRLPEPPPVSPPARATRTPTRDTLDLATIVVPMLFAAVMAVAVDPRFALMGLAGPIVTAANHFARRRRARRDDARHELGTRTALARFRHDLAIARAGCLHLRRQSVPDLGEIASRVHRDHTRLWERRGTDDDFLRLAVGTGSIAWSPLSRDDERDLDDAARHLVDEHGTIDDAPIVIDARLAVGIRGDELASLALVRALVLQAVALHGPADLRLVVATTAAQRDEWDWAEWLPHTHDPRLPARLVAGNDAGVRELVEHLVATADADDGHTWVVVDDATLVANRTMPLRQLLRALPRSSVTVMGRANAPLPSFCHTVVDVTREMTAMITQPALSEMTANIRGAGISRDTATRSAARLARFADPEAAVTTAPLPSSVSLFRLLTSAAGELSVDARWAASRHAGSFVVPIGVDCDGPLVIDLVHDGPHLLVAGTTGSGKSELLRTLITSLAATIDPQRINFLLVDYKGGSAFDRCGALPHTVGVVTDLDGRLTARALTCLEAELRRREHALRDAGVDDIADYHRRVDQPLSPLPRLVVVVDELAALMAELPRFVDSLIDIGQRGRSLGVHLVLATQRPSGVVNDALRANTNLRISLRVLDQNDSRDVLGVPAAAAIGRHQPGRAIARMGATELVTFQGASVSGSSRRTVDASVRIAEHPQRARRDERDSVADLSLLVEAITDSYRRAGHAPPWRPWPDPLPDRITLDELDRLDGRAARPPDWSVAFGLADVPHEQRRVIARWQPAGGPLLVHSLRGGGATTALATVAIDLARHHAPDRVHLYVLDLGAGDLAPLVDLPHCGAYITASEHERQTRLSRWLTDEIRSRAEVATVDRRACPTIVVLVDNLAALGAAPDAEAQRDALRRLVSDGAAVDVHLASSTDRSGALGHTTDALVAQRVALRLAEPADYSMIGVRGVDPAHLPAGRGFALPGAREVQIALPHHDSLQAAVAIVAAKGARRTAPPIAVLPTVVARRAIAAAPVPAQWVIGLLDRTLGPAILELAPGDHALIAGPARSGKSNALALIARAAQHSGATVHLVAPPRSPLAGGPLAGALVSIDGLASLVDSLFEADRTGGQRERHVVVVDDAESIDDSGHFERLLVGCPRHVHVIASARADRLRAAYRHWTTELRRSRIGVLLRPDDVDGELLGVRLPRGGAVARVAGRGYLVTDLGIELVQLAVADEPDGESYPR